MKAMNILMSEILQFLSAFLSNRIVTGSQFICPTIRDWWGRDSPVGIATRYGLVGPGIVSRWGGGEIFRTRPDRPCGPPSLLYNGYRVRRPGRGADPPTPLHCRGLKKGRAIPLPALRALVAYKGETFSSNFCTFIIRDYNHRQ